MDTVHGIQGAAILATEFASGDTNTLRSVERPAVDDARLTLELIVPGPLSVTLMGSTIAAGQSGWLPVG